jgi:hypothetical protein
MEEALGRSLTREELVHHIDGDKLNNSLENLAVMEKAAHHKIAHHSLQKIGYDLVRAGLVTFDRGTQEYVAHLKLRELLGHLEAGNQQPSRDSDDSEGSETRDETLVVNKFPTSAGHPIG